MRAFLSRVSRKIKHLVLGFVAFVAAFFGVLVLGEDASLAWSAPVQLENGDPLTDLAGYRVYYSRNGGAFEEIADVPGESYLHANVGIGEHCYRVTAYRVVDGQLLESEPSNTACKTVLDRLRPTAPSGLTVQ